VRIADVVDFLSFGVRQHMLGDEQIDTVDFDRLFFIV
jgi:hypothetical protein